MSADLVTFGIRAKKVIQLRWTNWSAICEEFPRFIDEDNPGKDTNLFHNTCGEEGPYILLYVPPSRSAFESGQQAYHGDYIVLLENGKIMVVPVPVDADTYVIGESAEIHADFVFNKEDFPLLSRWAHRNGNIYTILGYGNLPDEDGKTRPGYETRIWYANAKTAKTYDRAAHDWHRSMLRIN